jgi:hypothetical protein
MTSAHLTLLRPPTSGRRDSASSGSDGITTSTTVDRLIPTTLVATIDPTLSLYVTAPGVRPVRIHPLHHRPRRPAPYIPIGDRFPDPRIIDGQTQRADLTYEEFLLIEPTPTVVVVPAPAVVS